MARRWSPLVVLVVWLVVRGAVGSPAGVRTVAVGAACQAMAWGLTAAVLGVSAGAVTGRRAAGPLAVTGMILCAGWLHRLPPYLAADPVHRFLGAPPGGTLRPAELPWDTGTLVGWTAAWTVIDVLVMLLVCAVAWPWLPSGPAVRSAPVRTPTLGRGHVAVAVAAVAVVVLAVASVSGLVAGGAASAGAATSFAVAGAIPLVTAGTLGSLGRRRRMGPRPVAALLGALGLDTAAGLLGERYPESGPWRLVASPGGLAGQWQSAPAILAMSAVTVVACVALLSVGPLARALQALQRRPRTALVLGLIADTVDAGATRLGLDAGSVAEANPLVRATGLTAKWVAVSILLLVLYRIRPGTVWIVVAAYVLVVGYHVLGLLLLA